MKRIFLLVTISAWAAEPNAYLQFLNLDAYDPSEQQQDPVIEQSSTEQLPQDTRPVFHYRCLPSNEGDERLNHMIKHSALCPDRDFFTCQICRDTFKTAKGLMKHRKVHEPSVERRYACGACPAFFLRLGTLSMHKRRVHSAVK